MKEVFYKNLQICKYRYFQQLLGICVNTVIAFISGLAALTNEMEPVLWWLLIGYSVVSTILLAYLLPRYLTSYEWLLSRPKSEFVEIVREDAGHVLINGILWDLALGRDSRIVLDCANGIAYVPTLSFNMKSTN